MYIVYTTALFLVVHLSLGVAELQCPQVGYVGSNAKLTCIGESDTHAYSKPAGSTASTCDVGRRKCIDTGDDKGEVINATHTTLTIPKVKPSDAGEWGCTVGRSDTRSMCTMAVANVPRCNISSYNNTDVLTLHEELTLTVDIQEYYCSAQYTFSLLYGNENAQLPISESVKKTTNKTANINVNITASALGGIRLLFGCHNTQQNVSCGGFKFTKVVPRCSITSNNTADTAGLHKNLSVDIQNYFCSSANSFTLLVGNVRQSLSPAEIGNKLTSVTVNTTLNIKESYSGPVKLIFQCQDQQDELTCEGHLSIKGVAELQCPQVGYVGSNAKLTCIGESDTHAYSKPAGSTASTCDVGRRKCIDTGDDKGEVINATHTTLTIPKVKPSDAGEWGCTVGRSDTRSMCTMAVANVPRCNISSYNNTDVLTLHEELTLTVDIQEYYCSAQYTFSLLYGNENAQLPISESVKKTTNKTANINVNITASALGGIRLLFGCHNTQQNVSCGGFKFTKVVPRCSITSNNTADTAGLHKNLSVDIQNYFCSSANSFTLLVGNVRQSLSPAEIGNKLTSVTVNTTLNIKESYSGPVKLIFQCQDQQDELTCEGHLSIKVSANSANVLDSSWMGYIMIMQQVLLRLGI
ncbi:uncharacterized protein [Haliotis asinina]|uniref:uncharacterized protein isoform X2 n=1 Tax=Haliotis asinina TaxID=109174 RepID=UPI00353244BC